MNEYLKRLLELNFTQGEKVKISPIGEVVGVDGRTYRIDGDRVVLNTKEKLNIDLVFEVDHGYGIDGGAASGWFDINSLEARDDGIYAALNLTDRGSELVDKKLYRYLSPAFIMDRNSEDRTVLSIESVGLVNHPNILDTALNNKQKQSSEDEPDLETVVEENKTKYESEITTLKTSLKEANSKIKTLTIDLAIERNAILPKDREFCMSLDEAQLNSYIKSNAGASLAKDLGTELNANVPQDKTDLTKIAAQAGSKG